jgi:hypothetical protein
MEVFLVAYNGCFFFGVLVYVEESIVNSDQPVKLNLTFCVFLIRSLKNQSFLRPVVYQMFKSNLTFCVCVFNQATALYVHFHSPLLKTPLRK